MPRPPKIKPAAADASGSGAVVPANNAVPKVIDVDNFIRVRDSVHARLSTIQDLIKSFSADYLRQTNLLLGEGTQIPEGADMFGLDNAMNLIAPPPGAPQPVLEPATDGKKERKKRTHDPDAPKRPLTPYFLYMQTARPIIAADLGPEAAKGAVQEEGQRRWGTMSDSDKHGWDQAYQYNLRLYNARVHAYKQGGDKNAKHMNDEDALKYAEEHHIPMPNQKDGATDQDQIAQQLQQVEEPAAPAPVATPAKTPKSAAKPATGGRKRKSTAITPSAAGEESAAKGSAASTAASPEKKRKRTSKAAAAAAEEEAKPEPEPKKSGRKKKAT